MTEIEAQNWYYEIDTQDLEFHEPTMPVHIRLRKGDLIIIPKERLDSEMKRGEIKRAFNVVGTQKAHRDENGKVVVFGRYTYDHFLGVDFCLVKYIGSEG